jgi:hypothetical protein
LVEKRSAGQPGRRVETGPAVPGAGGVVAIGVVVVVVVDPVEAKFSSGGVWVAAGSWD